MPTRRDVCMYVYAGVRVHACMRVVVCVYARVYVCVWVGVRILHYLRFMPKVRCSKEEPSLAYTHTYTYT